MAKAVFMGTIVQRLLPRYIDEQTEIGNEIELEHKEINDEKTAVIGPRQQVMFFIGYVAGHGEVHLHSYHPLKFS